jgi:hypothetical protein
MLSVPRLGPNSRVIYELQIGTDLEGSHCLLDAPSKHFTGRVEENHENLRVANVLVKIQTEDLPNTSLEWYCCDKKNEL